MVLLHKRLNMQFGEVVAPKDVGCNNKKALRGLMVLCGAAAAGKSAWKGSWCMK